MIDHHADNLLGELLAGRLTRRELMVKAAVLGLSATTIGALLAACGTNTTTGTAASTS